MNDFLPPVVRVTVADPDGYYAMSSGQTLVHEFEIPSNAHISVILEHMDRYAQDFSLRCWFSKIPNGLRLFEEPDHSDAWNMGRVQRVIEIHDESLREYADTRLLAPAGLKLFLNIQNLQNAPNSYRLQFVIPA